MGLSGPGLRHQQALSPSSEQTLCFLTFSVTLARPRGVPDPPTPPLEPARPARTAHLRGLRRSSPSGPGLPTCLTSEPHHCQGGARSAGRAPRLECCPHRGGPSPYLRGAWRGPWGTDRWPPSQAGLSALPRPPCVSLPLHTPIAGNSLLPTGTVPASPRPWLSSGDPAHPPPPQWEPPRATPAGPSSVLPTGPTFFRVPSSRPRSAWWQLFIPVVLQGTPGGSPGPARTLG